MAEHADRAAGVLSAVVAVLGLLYLAARETPLFAVQELEISGAPPSVRTDVARAADHVGSTEYIIRTLREAPAGSSWAVGTEYHLVQRLAKTLSDKKIVILSKDFCMCATMYRISPQNLLWALERIVQGEPVNEVRVAETTKRWARVALDRMLQVQ